MDTMTKFPMNYLIPPPSLLLLFIIPDHPVWKPSRALVITVATAAFMLAAILAKAVAMTKATPTGIPILATRAAKLSSEAAAPHSEVRK